MANYYVQFSEIVPNLTGDEEQWLQKTLAKLAAKDDPPGFQFDFGENGESGKYLWLYSEESGDPAQAAAFVRRFLKKFRPDDCWSLTYAEICDKPRVGAFSGGGLFVTAKSVDVFTAVEHVLRYQHRFRASRSKGRAGRRDQRVPAQT